MLGFGKSKATTQLLADLEEMLQQAAQGDAGTLATLRNDRDNNGEWTRFIRQYNDAELTKKFHAAIEQGILAHRTNTQVAEIGLVYMAWDRASSKEEQITCLVAYLHILEEKRAVIRQAEIAFNFSAQQAIEILNNTLLARRNELLENARLGSARAFSDVEWLISDTNNARNEELSDRPFFGLPIAGLQKPDDWDVLLVRHVERPRRAQFRQRLLSRCDMAFIAAKAEREKNIVDAWYIVAGVIDGCPITENEVPDAVYANLLRLVENPPNSTKPA